MYKGEMTHTSYPFLTLKKSLPKHSENVTHALLFQKKKKDTKVETIEVTCLGTHLVNEEIVLKTPSVCLLV